MDLDFNETLLLILKFTAFITSSKRKIEARLTSQDMNIAKAAK